MNAPPPTSRHPRSSRDALTKKIGGAALEEERAAHGTCDGTDGRQQKDRRDAVG